jgi:diguanylate cyclase (GGDEF)-like protein
MNSRPGTLRSLLLPGGVLLLLAVLLLQGGIVTLSASAVDFFNYSIFLAATLLAWRFHSRRILSALILLLVAHHALEFFSSGKVTASGTGRIAFEAVAFLLPLNFAALAFDRERRLAVVSAVPRLLLLFVQSVFVALMCRPGATSAPAIFHSAILSQQLFRWTRIPQPALLAFLIVLAILLARFFFAYKPSDAGLFWSLAAVLAGMHAGGVSRIGSAYFATAALLLASSIIETSYALAYHDELTGLPARRAFNQALTRLSAPYAIAAADIDHFKSFNDTYGHDTGDQILRMVASRLARVGGGGRAYRVGGEEFNILFPGMSAKDALPHLEALRVDIEQSRFRTRGLSDRRSASRGADRRAASNRRTVRTGKTMRPPSTVADAGLSVTISIGVAEANSAAQTVDQVADVADKALYRAKRTGRNRAEVGADRPRTKARRASA